MKSSQFQVLMDLRRYYIFIQRNNAFTSVKAKQKKKWERGDVKYDRHVYSNWLFHSNDRFVHDTILEKLENRF